MRLPVVWITAAFAAGIAAAMAMPPARPHSASVWAAAALAAILAGAALAWRSSGHERERGSTLELSAAWACALLAWFALGGTAVRLERASVPANHVTRLIAAGRLDTSEPLRWRGRLREDPIALPWG